MGRGRIGLADMGVLALLIALAAGTAFLQNRHHPLALYDQNIRATIEAQIAAFRAQDDIAAFGFASPDLRAQFVAPNRFMAMVRAHYRPVFTAKQWVRQRDGKNKWDAGVSAWLI
jgi:Tfp pilus assembly protein PilP